MKRNMTRLLLLLLSLMLACGLWAPALAAKAVTYTDENGVNHTVTSYREITGMNSFGGGVWVTTDKFDSADRELTLSADATLIVNSPFSCEGINLGGHSLTIYGNNSLFILSKGIGGAGALTVCGGRLNSTSKTRGLAALHATDGVTIKGGRVHAVAESESESAPAIGGCKVVISGGSVYAHCENDVGAAIGGGRDQTGDVTITGGSVEANTFNAGAAIGGAKGKGANITISGGSVNAYIKNRHATGAAIGGGQQSAGGSIVITGGSVRAATVTKGGYTSGAPAIGSGQGGWSGAVTITGGSVTAVSGGCNAIGSGRGGNISGPISITGGSVTARDVFGAYSGIATNGGLTLGWSSLSDRISGGFIAADYHPEKVQFQQGKYFWLGETGVVATPGNLDGRALIPSEQRNICRVDFCTPLIAEPWHTQYVPMGASASDPGDPYAGAAGYAFTGWRQGGFNGGAWDFDSAVTGDLSLYGDYQSAVTLKYGNGQPDQTAWVPRGGRLTRPADPTNSAASFAGWKAAGESGAYDFSAAVNAPFTLEAQWIYQGIAYEGGATSDYTAMNGLNGTALTTGDYVVTEDTVIGEALTVSGTVNLILLDGATLTANKGIIVNDGNTLNIYGQSGGTGKLVSTGAADTGNAGIGSRVFRNSGAINIYGGIVEATGNQGGAGIGGGSDGRGNVTIYGGTVTARPGGRGAAIGGGNGAGAEVIIYSGTVYAYTGSFGAGIGGGYGGSNIRVTIYGGDITATGCEGAGIGGGYEGSNIRVTIYGGDITATSRYGAGIGAGENGTDAAVTFKWDEAHKNPITLNDTRISNPAFEGSFMLQDTGELADAANLGGKTLVPCYGIRFDGAGAEGAMAARGVAIGERFTLPGCGFTAPAGRTFVCWTADGAEYQPGQTLTPAGDLTLSALWLDAQALSFEGCVETTVEVTDDQGNTTTQTVQDHNAFEARYGDAPFINAVTGAHTPVTWQSGDSTVATVNAATGEVTLVGAGQTAIYATAARSDTWAPATAQYTLTVLPRRVDPSITVTDTPVYTGVAITPAVTVKDGQTTIPADEYTLAWENNVNAGEACVIVTDKPGGSYDLARTCRVFVIAQRPLTVTGIAAKNKHYDGGTDVELDFSGVVFDGLAAGDSLSVSAVGAFETAEPGGQRSVSITDIALGGSDAANYALTSTTASTSATIYAPHTVNFVDGGALLETQTVLNGAYAETPDLQTEPAREGYRFVGWNLDGAPFDFETPLDFESTRTLTLTPRFSELYRVVPRGRLSSDTGVGNFSWTSSAGGTADDIQDNGVDSYLLAAEGDTITVTAIPGENSALDRFTIQYYYEYGNGEYVLTDIPFTVPENDANRATFTVPVIPVTHTIADQGDAIETCEHRVYISGSFTSTIDSLTLDQDASGAYLVDSAQDFIKLKRWIELDHDMAGQTVKLTRDIDLTGTGFSGLGSFSGTFNGDGHTVTGWDIYKDNQSAGFFRFVNQGGVVENLTLKGSVYGSGSGSRVGGLASYNNGVIRGCVIKVIVSDYYMSDNGGIVGMNEGTITGCQYLGLGGSFGNTVMNPVGIGDGAVTGCTPLYAIEGNDLEDSGIVTIHDDIDDYYPAGSGVTLSLSAPERAGWTLNGFRYQLCNEETGEYEDVNLTDNHDGTYTLTVPATNVLILPNYSYNALASLQRDSRNRYLIRSAADLRAVAGMVDVLEGCSGMTFLLANDLDNVGDFSGIAVGTDYSFEGMFDGDGHTISGMRITAEAGNVGFIGAMGTDEHLKRLTLRNCSVTNTSEYGYTGMLAGGGWYASLSDCLVLGGSVTGPGAGAISGEVLSGTQNLYTSDVCVISDGEEKLPGECGTSQGDQSGYERVNAAKVAWTVRFLDGVDGETKMAGPMFVPSDNSIDAAPAVTFLPEHAHLTFSGEWQWKNGEEFAFETDAITADTTLYALWDEEETYTVTLNYGSDVVELPVYVSDAEAGWLAPENCFNLATGEVLDYWAYNDSSYHTGDPITFSGNITLTAVTRAKDYAITVQEAAHGSISTRETAHYSDTVPIIVSPRSGYELDTLTYRIDGYEPVTIEASGHVYTFSMPDHDVILTATFRPLDYTVRGSLEHGRFQVNGVAADAPVTAHCDDWVSVIPDPGYRVNNVSAVASDGRAIEVEHGIFTMPADDVNVTATFERVYEINPYPIDEHGYVVVSDEAAAGETVDIVYLPDDGYELASIAVTGADGSPVSVNNQRFIMPASDVTVTVVFRRIIPDFGTPDFTLPAALNSIEESAFEGVAGLRVVDAAHCASVGKWAFRNTGLTQIRLPKNCAIDDTAFTGCDPVFIYAPAGGSTEAFCADRSNVIFAGE